MPKKNKNKNVDIDVSEETDTPTVDIDVTEEVSDTEEACLLYTSPSPRDGLLSRMPSSA